MDSVADFLGLTTNLVVAELEYGERADPSIITLTISMMTQAIDVSYFVCFKPEAEILGFL